MSTCDLCDLPTPDPPVTQADFEGEFCCRGCLEVAQVLEDLPVEADVDATDTVATADRTIPDDAAEAFLAIDGMHCTTCEVFLDYRGDGVPGIYAVDANYATETARVHYNPAEIDREELPDLLSGHGYKARFRDSDDDPSREGAQRRSTTPMRLVVGGFFTMLVMPWYIFYLYPGYVGLETGIVDGDATSTLGLYIPLVFVALFTTVVLFYTGFPILRGAWVSIRTRTPNMDLLVAIAAVAAFAYSTVALATGGTHLYYDVSVAIVMVVTLGRYYEGRIRARTTDALSALTAARVREATRLVDEGRETVSVDDLSPGDCVVVTPGNRVPVDGTVTEGVAAVDESILTGESLPVTKRPGDQVVGGSLVEDDALVVEVGPEAESTADRIATALWEIQSDTPGIQRIADRLATIFVPLVLTIGLVVTAWQLGSGGTVATALLAGLTVLVVSCPCAMGLATPLAISAGLRDALRQGIVFTNESVFEVASEADIVVFDKTGTLTTGEMAVLDVTGDEQTLRMAAAVERLSSHPAADAILDAMSEETNQAVGSGGAGDLAETDSNNRDTHPSDHLPGVSDFERHAGSGVAGTVGDTRVVVGTLSLVEQEVGPAPDTLVEAFESARAAGTLPVAVGWNDQVQGVIVVGDQEREAWDTALKSFADKEVVVLTGDETPSRRFRDHPAVDQVFTGVPPDGKVEAVRGLAATGTTVMVGDGTNDAPALATASLGIAIGDSTARAVDAADVVVTNDDLTAVEDVFGFAAGTRRRIHENIGWAFLYNAVAIPLAVAGVLNPLFAALAMAASSIIVVSNSRRPV